MKTAIKKTILFTLLLGLTALICAMQDGQPAASASSAPSASSSAPATHEKPKLSLLRQAMQDDSEKKLKQECIEKTLRALGLDPKDVTVEAHPQTEARTNTPAITYAEDSLIRIMPWLANCFISSDQRERDMATFVLGHEAFHIVQNHLAKKTFLFWWLSDIQKALNKLFGYPDAMQREKEKEADIESALATGCAQGGIDFFKEYLSPDSKDTEHPTVTQRCAYLQPIADLQAQGKTEEQIRKQLNLHRA